VPKTQDTKTSTYKSNFELYFCRHLYKNTYRGSENLLSISTKPQFILIFFTEMRKITIIFQTLRTEKLHRDRIFS